MSNRSLCSSPEITVDIDSQGIDQIPVNQRVAGSSPADGAIFYACHKDVTVRVGGPFREPLRESKPKQVLDYLILHRRIPLRLARPIRLR